jgi:hypothetical protein
VLARITAGNDGDVCPFPFQLPPSFPFRIPPLGFEVVFEIELMVGGKKYKISSLPSTNNGTLAPTGQVYVVLSTADGVSTKVSDENTLSGVGIIEVTPVGNSTGVF